MGIGRAALVARPLSRSRTVHQDRFCMPASKQVKLSCAVLYCTVLCLCWDPTDPLGAKAQAPGELAD